MEALGKGLLKLARSPSGKGMPGLDTGGGETPADFIEARILGKVASVCAGSKKYTAVMKERLEGGGKEGEGK